MYKEIIILAVRISAIAFFVYGVQHIGNNYFFFHRFLENEGRIPSLYIILFTVPFIISVLLWVFSIKIASALVKDISMDVTESKTNPEQIREVAFSVVGLTLLVYTFSKLMFWIYWYASFNPDQHQKPDLVGLGIVVVINIIIGVWLLFGSRGIANFIHRLRYAGMDK